MDWVVYVVGFTVQGEYVAATNERQESWRVVRIRVLRGMVCRRLLVGSR